MRRRRRDLIERGEETPKKDKPDEDDLPYQKRWIRRYEGGPYDGEPMSCWQNVRCDRCGCYVDARVEVGEFDDLLHVEPCPFCWVAARKDAEAQSTRLEIELAKLRSALENFSAHHRPCVYAGMSPGYVSCYVQAGGFVQGDGSVKPRMTNRGPATSHASCSCGLSEALGKGMADVKE